MCEYCEKVIGRGRKKTETEECELMKNFPIIDDFTEKEIQNNGENPVQYIRKYKGRYLLVTEFGNNDGDAILSRINYCPMCGRKLGSGMSVISEQVKELRDLENDPEIDCYGINELNNVCARAANTIEALSEKLAAKNNSGWISCNDRLPSKEEYEKDDGRFIVTDGNRRYQSCFDIYSKVFRTLKLNFPSYDYGYEYDKCVIAWQPLPEPYKGEEEAEGEETYQNKHK